MGNKKIYILINGIHAGILEESEDGKKYSFAYDDYYRGEGISLTIPVQKKIWEFERFPEYFENLLPEGLVLEGVCKLKEIGKNDYFSQLVAAGNNLLGNVTTEKIR